MDECPCQWVFDQGWLLLIFEKRPQPRGHRPNFWSVCWVGQTKAPCCAIFGWFRFKRQCVFATAGSARMICKGLATNLIKREIGALALSAFQVLNNFNLNAALEISIMVMVSLFPNSCRPSFEMFWKFSVSWGAGGSLKQSQWLSRELGGPGAPHEMKFLRRCDVGQAALSIFANFHVFVMQLPFTGSAVYLDKIDNSVWKSYEPHPHDVILMCLPQIDLIRVGVLQEFREF